MNPEEMYLTPEEMMEENELLFNEDEYVEEDEDEYVNEDEDEGLF
jgi:hypothetical protein